MVTADGSRAALKYFVCRGDDSNTFIVEPEKGCCGLTILKNHYATGTSLEETLASSPTHFSVLTCSAFRAWLLHRVFTS